MKTSSLIVLALFCSLSILSQNLQLCGADEFRADFIWQNPELKAAVEKRELVLETFTSNFIEHPSKKSSHYVIPVVFHVIHNNGIENIDDSQILNSIEVLNERLNKQSADTGVIHPDFKAIHANCEIEFRIARTDPDGFCTNGINRIESPLTTVGDHQVKDLIQWPTNMYLNVYVVRNAAGLAGHAVWPSDADTLSSLDGIVMAHNYLGRIGTSNPTRSVVLAHEVGHYLNLHHIWGGNNVPGFYFLPCADPNKDCAIDDYVADTPPTIGWTSCNLNGTTCDSTRDNVQNMMEYSYCNKMFTHGQKDRMHACLNSSIAGRNNLHTQDNLMATGVLDTNNIGCEVLSSTQLKATDIKLFPNPAHTTLDLISDKKSDFIRYSIYSTDGQLVTSSPIHNRPICIEKIASGLYILEIETKKNSWIRKKFVIE